MGKYTKISADAVNNMQFEAGLLLKTFNPASPSAVSDSDIICATTGGIRVYCTPNFQDYGADIDNVPNNTKEFKGVDDYACGIDCTALDATPDVIKMAIGVADITEGHIKPRANIGEEDFNDEIWWVGDRLDGGFVAVKLANVLSTGGLSIQTTKKGKGQLALTLTAHYSVSNIDEVPFDAYAIEG